MEPIETIAWHEIIHQGELHDWRAAQLIRLGFPRPLAEAVADHVTGTKSPRSYTAAADRGSP